MGLLDITYLTPDQIRGFDNYKYSSVDTSPIAVYVSHPFWNWLVEFFPKWIAPNVLTLAGMLLVMCGFVLVSYFDYYLLASSDLHPEYLSIPDIIWLILCIFTFTAHVLDGTDGKQARRTGSSGPTGELFDHGIDSWLTVPFTVTLFSIFGREDYSVPAYRQLFILMSVQLVFVATHWEKYNTGVLFLSWGYDLSQYMLALMYLVTFVGGGYKMWKFSFHFPLVPFIDITPAKVGEFIFYASCFVMSIPMSIHNIRRSNVNRTGKMYSFYEATLPLGSTFILFGAATVWAFFSPTKIIDQDPRIFFWAMGTIFSNIAVRLIIAQMSQTRCEPFNWMLLPYLLVVGLSVLWRQLGLWELVFLRSLSVLVTIAHVHYCVCVVRQMCDHFGICCFSLKKPVVGHDDYGQGEKLLSTETEYAKDNNS